MEIIKDFLNFKSKEPSIVTVGTFDGVHLGHQKILKELTTQAKKYKALSTVLTFFPHPRMVLQQDKELKLIDSMQEKAIRLKKNGVDRLVICPFDKKIASLNAEEYISEIILNKLNTKMLVVGYDHRFGKNRLSDINDLKKLSQQYHFQIKEIDAKQIDEISISSTKVRNYVKKGNISKANEYLGHPFMISGNVISGEQIGRKIGFPTANVFIEESYKILPKSGVYIVKSLIKNKNYIGMMNIGTKPTFNNKKQTIETFLLNFKGELYGEKITLFLLKRIRDEKKFSSIQELKSQIKIDESYTLNYIEKNKCIWQNQ